MLLKIVEKLDIISHKPEPVAIVNDSSWEASLLPLVEHCIRLLEHLKQDQTAQPLALMALGTAMRTEGDR